MSTNYYAYQKIPMGQRRRELKNAFDAEELRMKLHETFDKEENPIEIRSAIDEYVGTLTELYNNLMPKQIHLGKSSCGWQFKWQMYKNSEYEKDQEHNSKFLYYEPNLESIKAFLYDTEHWIIADEYGKVLTPDEFLEEIKPVLYKTDDLYDDHSYAADPTQVHSQWEPYFLSQQHTSEDGLRWTFDEFS